MLVTFTWSPRLDVLDVAESAPKLIADQAHALRDSTGRLQMTRSPGKLLPVMLALLYQILGCPAVGVHSRLPLQLAARFSTFRLFTPAPRQSNQTGDPPALPGTNEEGIRIFLLNEQKALYLAP